MPAFLLKLFHNLDVTPLDRCANSQSVHHQQPSSIYIHIQAHFYLRFFHSYFSCIRIPIELIQWKRCFLLHVRICHWKRVNERIACKINSCEHVYSYRLSSIDDKEIEKRNEWSREKLVRDRFHRQILPFLFCIRHHESIILFLVEWNAMRVSK